MSILCFFVTFPIKRLLAYKISYAHQRVIPRVEEGIGAWRSIMNFIAYIGVTCTCYIVTWLWLELIETKQGAPMAGGISHLAAWNTQEIFQSTALSVSPLSPFFNQKHLFRPTLRGDFRLQH